ncbi:MAG: tyrosine decarboxylase MfnA [Methanosphaera sp.]|nr:tyrosine decarboxylase MfnA [Methanosphaera sp.]
MFRKRHDKRYIFEKLEAFHQMDMTYDSGRILSSMCTKPDDIALEAFRMFIETNLGDGGLFKGTSMMEEEVIASLAKLLHSDDACGHIVTGGTEANIMAMTVAKYLFQEDNDNTPELILPRTAHFSFKKACSMLSLNTVEVPLNDKHKIDIERLEECITDNTMAIVAIAGSTEFGLVDDIGEISKIAKSNDVYLHVDAALGGFIIPFLNYRNNTQLNFDFKCKGVSSITLDPHKMGLAPVPAGGILFRHKKYLDKLAIDAPYLTKNVQTTIVGTRTGATTAAAWALINYYGMDGYADIVEESINLTRYTYNRLSQMNHVQVIVKPELNVIAFNVSDMKVNELKEKLFKKGWRVSNTVNPYAVRLVLMPHVKKQHIDRFLVDLEEIIREYYS